MPLLLNYNFKKITLKVVEAKGTFKSSIPIHHIHLMGMLDGKVRTLRSHILLMAGFALEYYS